MNHTSRSVVTATRKRKDRGEIENSCFYKGSFGNSHHHKPLLSGNNNINNINNNYISTTSSTTTSTSSRTTLDPGYNSSSPNPNPGSSNRLLAGYMAHEFLTKGTLFGQKFDPARAEAVPVSAAEPKRKSGHTPGFEPGLKPNRSYADVAHLLKSDGAHIPGIVNPTQLARWIQM